VGEERRASGRRRPRADYRAIAASPPITTSSPNSNRSCPPESAAHALWWQVAGLVALLVISPLLPATAQPQPQPPGE